MRRNSLPRRGFTLVELLVVIGIIALLISILLPVLNKAREQAKSVACESNMKQVLLAFQMYVNDSKGATPVPPAIAMTYPGSNNIRKSLMYYMDSANSGAGLYRYDVGPFWNYCASGLNQPANPPHNHATTPPNQQLYRLMNCPSDVEFRTVRWGSINVQDSLTRNFSYSWNVELYPANDGGPTWPGDRQNVSKTSQIYQPGHKIILIEEASPNDAWAYIISTSNDQDDTPAWRHIGHGNMGFADGHVESLSPTDMGYQLVRSETQFANIVNQQTVGYYFHLSSDRYR